MVGGYYTAIETVKNYGYYIEDLYDSCPLEYSFDEVSYSKWAISMLLERLEYCLPGEELLTMEAFGHEMVEYARLNQRTSRIFLVAYDVVCNAIDLYM
ncbi:hypothetical protein [Neglectibacter caecimuris]|uniref:hypothetical protein n=1 Tax=Neglectibacter caecimuris TaxID=3093658 RepID=UPI002AC9289C|nr:hypothetical protein [Neglectibacter sp. M00184]